MYVGRYLKMFRLQELFSYKNILFETEKCTRGLKRIQKYREELIQSLETLIKGNLLVFFASGYRGLTSTVCYFELIIKFLNSVGTLGK